MSSDKNSSSPSVQREESPKITQKITPKETPKEIGKYSSARRKSA